MDPHNAFTEMLDRYEKNPSRTMRLEDLRQLLLDTVMEINCLKVILLNPKNFTVAADYAAARAATAASAAITYTEELTHSRVQAAVNASRPVLTRDLCGLSTADSSVEARPAGRGRGGRRRLGRMGRDHVRE